MPFRVQIHPPVERRIAAWGLSDSVLVEVHLRLRERLARDPQNLLRRVRQPYDGMVHPFSLVDPEDRFLEYFFTFQVVYGQDETSLWVIKGSYVRRHAL